MATRPHFIFLGGFLGAGKTTAVAQLARYVADQGLRPALITNDQGAGLVDTAVLAAQGFATAEVAGGCFCCRFDALIGAAEVLARGEPPDVFIAEAVGSCTDLVATVTRPLERLHGGRFTVAPLSVLVDPVPARRVLGLEAVEAEFSTDVRYIYEKQLEEAGAIAVNKIDRLAPEALDALLGVLARRFPRARRFGVSARDGANLAPWFHELLHGRAEPQPAIELDYERYAAGEARLGWLNASARLAAAETFDGDAALLRLAAEIQTRLAAGGGAIAHLKLTLQPDDGGLAAANVVRNDLAPESLRRLGRRVACGRLLLNLRAEAAPAALGEAVREAFAWIARTTPGLKLELAPLECFRPGKPNPTHRDAAAPAAGSENFSPPHENPVEV